jgi:uncharacterized membrane protein
LTLAAVHISPFVALPIAAILAATLVWYWVQLGATDVPRSRRWIRRFSLAMSFALLLAAVLGVSFIDPRGQQSAYVVTWATVILIILMVMLTAVADIFNSLRLTREIRTRMEVDAAAELHRSIKEHAATSGRAPRIDSPTTNGSRKKHGHGAAS